MSKSFKKGDLVTYISNWDHKGTVIFRDAVVYSCGKKQMVLTDALTGEEMGRHFNPMGANIGECGTFPRLSENEAIAFALNAAQIILEKERAGFAHLLTTSSNEAYLAKIRESIEMLHEPRAMSHAEAMKQIK